jgi:hypothetical protein
MRRRLRWDADDEQPPPPHPYRDTALVYAGFAVVIVVVAMLTGGGLLRALVFAGLFWAAATGYGIVSWRRRLREREHRGVR